MKIEITSQNTYARKKITCRTKTERCNKTAGKIRAQIRRRHLLRDSIYAKIYLSARIRERMPLFISVSFLVSLLVLFARRSISGSLFLAVRIFRCEFQRTRKFSLGRKETSKFCKSRHNGRIWAKGYEYWKVFHVFLRISPTGIYIEIFPKYFDKKFIHFYFRVKFRWKIIEIFNSILSTFHTIILFMIPVEIE